MSETFAGLDELLNATAGKRRYKAVTLPIAGIAVRIRSLFEKELSAYSSAVIGTGSSGPVRARIEDAGRRLIVLCVVDAEGNQLLNHTHLAKLGEWDAMDTAYLYDECAKHCGIRREEIENLIKNSDATAAAD